MAATILAEVGLTEPAVAERIAAHAPRADDPPADPPYTPRATQVYSGALSEALSLGHNYVGTEHLLLALFRDPEGLAAQLLTDAGASHASCKERVVTILSGFVSEPGRAPR